MIFHIDKLPKMLMILRRYTARCQKHMIRQQSKTKTTASPVVLICRCFFF